LHYKGLYSLDDERVKPLYKSKKRNMVRVREFVYGGIEGSAFLTPSLLSNNIEIS